MGAQGLCGSSADTSGVEALDTALVPDCRSERFIPLLLSDFSLSDSGRPYGLQPARLLCPWNKLGPN